MEWSKTKTIMIIALILTNIIIGYFYWQEYLQSARHAMGDQVATLEKIFMARSIDIGALAPIQDKSLPKINMSLDKVELEDYSVEGYRVALLDEHTVTMSLKMDAALKNALQGEAFSSEAILPEATAIEQAGAWLREELALIEDFRLLNAIESDEGLILNYGQVYKGYFVEGSFMSLVFHEGKVISLQRRWYDVEEFENQQLGLCPYPMALYRLYDQIMAQDSLQEMQFESVELGYKLESNAFDTVIESGEGAPYYRFKTSDGKTFLVEALWIQ